MAKAKTFTEDISNKDRLIQVWVILAGKARSRQTITYTDLAYLMRGKIKPSLGPRAGQWKGMQLGQLLTYCKERKLPLLPVIVVTKETGLPASMAPYNPPDVNAERERVFEFDWYSVHPPTEAEADLLEDQIQLNPYPKTCNPLSSVRRA